MRKLNSLLILVFALIPAIAIAQTTASDAAPLTRGWADFGVRGSSIIGDGARYERYRDLGDGLFLEGPSGQVNYAFNGLAAVALSVAGPGAQAASDSIVKALVPVKGLKGRNFKELGQDNSLQGWPWVDQTASWVEPTSWCLLALKRRREALASAALRARIDEAEKLLLDRACRFGGWNYGSPLIFDKSLPPQMPTTVMAILAMQDRLAHPVLLKAIEFLDANQMSERSMTALSLASIGGRVCGRNVGDVNEALLSLLGTREQGACTATAMAICALRGDPGVAPFRL